MRYLLLGTTEALGPDGTPLPLGGARLRALLAALALRGGRAVPVRELVDDVYGDEPPADAPAALQALVARLRRVLGREAVEATPGPGYRLVAGPQDIDLYVFERRAAEAGALLDAGDPGTAAALLRDALGLFRGPALADLPGPAGVRPEAQRLAALRRRVEADLRRGAADGLVPELTELTVTHPYDEGFHAQLVRALRAEGRHADALAAYETARRTLADGLGTDPGPELTALHRELLAPAAPAAARRPAPAPAPARAPVPLPDAPPAQDAPPAPTPLPAPAPAHAPAPAPAPETGNIRPRLTSFVGREPELAALRDDLGRSRLVTLTGPGGSGKTRLAEETARQVAGAHAWIAELAPLDDPGALPGAVLSALRLREINLITRDGTALQDDPTAHLVEHLAHRPGLLLVLDNCEHLIDAAAALAEALLAHCPGLRILATSREPLGVPGETVRPVEPLPPAPAHRLFTERARAVRPSFDEEQAHAPATVTPATEATAPATEATATDPDAVAEICRRLDGLPLAIELAAARLRLLTPRQIADRLDDRFRLLTSGARTLLPRQQTLRAVVDWSWDLLDPAERTLLRRVSVFTGGWDLPAAEAVDAPVPEGGTDTLTTLGALIDKSLVVAAPTDDGTMRYRLLETIHEYAAERAAETPELLAAAEAAHTAHFTALAEEAEPRLRSGEQLPWIDRLERDLDNIRAVLHRTLVAAPDELAGLRLVLAMGWFWWLRNYRPEGLAWTRRALALGEDPDDPADPRHWPRMHLRMLSFFLAMEDENMYTGDVREDAEALALVRRVRDAFGEDPGPESARFPGLLWPFTAYLTEEPATVRALLDAGVETCRRYGGDWELGVSLMFRTHMIVDMPGGMRGVDEDLAALRVLTRRVGDRWMGAQVASAAAEANMMRGRRAEAREAYEEALRLAREVGAHAEVPFLLARLAELTYRDGDTDGAERGLDEAARESERLRIRDALAFVDCMRAVLALDRDDPARARAWITSAGAHVRADVPPPHFAIALEGFVARIEAHEGAGPAAVGSAAAVLRTALGGHYADIVVISLAEGLAYALHRAGDAARCARVAAAVDTWRKDVPRSVPERREAGTLAAACRAALGEDGLAEARAAGAALRPEEVLALVEPYATGADDAVRSS
ncbi:BTAD domain-containing putative transcriptional regulator [Streptomyces sp. NPDC058052]|uniref:AfsR/SARP family transcriptional regulator n=1 Tax=Streptomyces sp. NPDC058052 TaxID=3346316 RepID=UPI0036E02E5C